MDDLTSMTQKYFDQDEIRASADFNNHGALTDFKKTRDFDFIPGVKPDDYDSDTDLHAALKRGNKLNQTNYILPPRKVMSTLHRKTHFAGAKAIKLGINSMKIRTKMFNENFIDVANNLPSARDQRHQKQLPRARSQASTGRSQMRGQQSLVDPDEEDRRLDRIQKMRNQEIDYCGLTTDVLKVTNQQRQPVAAQSANFLKKGRGPGGWGGHIEESARASTSYGKKGFGPIHGDWNRQRGPSESGSPQPNESSLMTPSTMHSSLMHSASRGTIVKKKNVVLRNALRGKLPKVLNF